MYKLELTASEALLLLACASVGCATLEGSDKDPYYFGALEIARKHFKDEAGADFSLTNKLAKLEEDLEQS